MEKRQDNERECNANGIVQRNLFRNNYNTKKTGLKAKDKLARVKRPKERRDSVRAPTSRQNHKS
jgi:hypothetical protein